jgi:hypothetical protein
MTSCTEIDHFYKNNFVKKQSSNQNQNIEALSKVVTANFTYGKFFLWPQGLLGDERMD